MSRVPHRRRSVLSVVPICAALVGAIGCTEEAPPPPNPDAKPSSRSTPIESADALEHLGDAEMISPMGMRTLLGRTVEAFSLDQAGKGEEAMYRLHIDGDPVDEVYCWIAIRDGEDPEKALVPLVDGYYEWSTRLPEAGFFELGVEVRAGGESSEARFYIVAVQGPDVGAP